MFDVEDRRGIVMRGKTYLVCLTLLAHTVVTPLREFGAVSLAEFFRQ